MSLFILSEELIPELVRKNLTEDLQLKLVGGRVHLLKEYISLKKHTPAPNTEIHTMSQYGNTTY